MNDKIEDFGKSTQMQEISVFDNFEPELFFILRSTLILSAKIGDLIGFSQMSDSDIFGNSSQHEENTSL